MDEQARIDGQGETLIATVMGAIRQRRHYDRRAADIVTSLAVAVLGVRHSTLAPSPSAKDVNPSGARLGGVRVVAVGGSYCSAGARSVS